LKLETLNFKLGTLNFFQFHNFLIFAPETKTIHFSDFKMNNHYTILNTAITASILAGQEILKIYNDPAADFSVERKADNSPLTVADKAAHKIIMQHLEKTGIPVLSEEGKNIPFETRKSWETFWLVDPLDGTKEFIKRNGEFTVNIALIENGRPFAGIIYVPVTKTLYAGSNGSYNNVTDYRIAIIHDKSAPAGAWKLTTPEANTTFEMLKSKGQKLPCFVLPQTYKLVGSRSHMSAETEEYIAARKKEFGEVNMISQGSSLKICLVAEGAAHEYPRFGPTMEWDTAAGHAIANAAGKKLWLTDFSGELSYNKENLLNPWFIVKRQ
jgi:3'(2'), 5'-bisphosphate nucleotidase